LEILCFAQDDGRSIFDLPTKEIARDVAEPQKEFACNTNTSPPKCAAVSKNVRHATTFVSKRSSTACTKAGITQGRITFA